MAADRGHTSEVLDHHAARGEEPRYREPLRVELAYRPPFDWERMLAFLGPRAVDGVERVADGVWMTTARLAGPGGAAAGWIRVANAPSRSCLRVEVAAGLARVLPVVVARVRRIFDLSCEPQVVAEALGELAASAPGLRIPGAFDGFQMAIAAILGQQVTVKAARTVVGRLARAFGEPVATPVPGIDLSFPQPATIAAASVDSIASLGIIRQRVAALQAVAAAVASGGLALSPPADVAETVRRLRALPGVGEWTAQYIALRALAWADAWPSGDVVLRKALGAGSRREADAKAERWRPWRGYAALHLWRRWSEEGS